MKPLHGNMKMADLIEVNYHLLAVLTRFGIEGGFGEKTVRDICEKNHLDTDTFLLICNALGLSDQVVMNPVYSTDGPSRRIPYAKKRRPIMLYGYPAKTPMNRMVFVLVSRIA